jgi:UDP-N-acetylmuramyl pentapeptide phosphotransferase/UDP-N-acetylglucosamine-1-phosphate transferase
MNQFIQIMVYVLGVSILTTFVIHLTTRLHGRFSLDNSDGVQKIHKNPAPRIGGVAVILAVFVGMMFLPDHAQAKQLGLTILLCAIPIISIGLTEDLTKSVSPRVRLASHIIGATMVTYFASVVLRHTGFNLTDPLMDLTIVAFIITVLCISGMTNAVNIIDGYNGLAAGSVIIMSVGIALLAVRLGDTDVFVLSLVLAAAVAGFFLINFPSGHVFLGDAGAYFCGFCLGTLAIALCARHPGLSPWVPLLVVIYPIWELLVSMARRHKRAGRSMSQPDRAHLHHLASRSIARPFASFVNWKEGQNPATSVVLWPLPLLTCVIAASVEMTSINALLGIILFQAFYERIYRLCVK